MVYCSWLFVYSKTRTERLLHAFPNLEIYLYERGERGTISYKKLDSKLLYRKAVREVG